MRRTLTALAALVVSLMASSPAGATAVVYGPCPGVPDALGCLYDDTIYVLEPGDRDTLLHEQGHVFDRDKLTDRDRAWFTRKLRMRGLGWREPRRGSDDESPAERFADAYALCHERVRFGPNRMLLTGYGYSPTPRRHRVICNAIAVLGIVRQ